MLYADIEEPSMSYYCIWIWQCFIQGGVDYSSSTIWRSPLSQSYKLCLTREETPFGEYKWDREDSRRPLPSILVNRFILSIFKFLEFILFYHHLQISYMCLSCRRVLESLKSSNLKYDKSTFSRFFNKIRNPINSPISFLFMMRFMHKHIEVLQYQPLFYKDLVFSMMSSYTFIFLQKLMAWSCLLTMTLSMSWLRQPVMIICLVDQSTTTWF